MREEKTIEGERKKEAMQQTQSQNHNTTYSLFYDITMTIIVASASTIHVPLGKEPRQRAAM